MITFLAHGYTYRQAAGAMGIEMSTLASYLSTTARLLGSPRRLPALVHACYCHPSFPAPQPFEDTAPTLSAQERLVLGAHIRGVTIGQLSHTTRTPRYVLTSANLGLLARLGGRTPAHGVRLAWRYGLLTEAGMARRHSSRPALLASPQQVGATQ
ncbi:hypothetical protein [Streptomyces roseifaciens]|uniref:hypothetical protein n=1 Tax=Streptomyces roseifaciens TaxID=1488406 RepID=UPI00118765BD|nr:hypothetical protein [Streptomyces roseifaciens]